MWGVECSCNVTQTMWWHKACKTELVYFRYTIQFPQLSQFFWAAFKTTIQGHLKVELTCGSLEFGLDPRFSKYTLKQEFLYKRRNKDGAMCCLEYILDTSPWSGEGKTKEVKSLANYQRQRWQLFVFKSLVLKQWMHSTLHPAAPWYKVWE